MANRETGLGLRLGGAFRENLADQGKAYKEYGSLLERLSAKEVKGIEFARSAIDIYVGAVGKTLASVVAMVGEIAGAGIKRASKAGSAAATAVAETTGPAGGALSTRIQPVKRARAKK